MLKILPLDVKPCLVSLIRLDAAKRQKEITFRYNRGHILDANLRRTQAENCTYSNKFYLVDRSRSFGRAFGSAVENLQDKKGENQEILLRFLAKTRRSGFGNGQPRTATYQRHFATKMKLANKQRLAVVKATRICRILNTYVRFMVFLWTNACGAPALAKYENF